MNDFLIDRHKLHYHPERVADWLRGENIFPLYVEVGPAGRCQQNCVFCAFDYIRNQGDLMGEIYMKVLIKQAADIGVKAIMFAGEGEPLMHPSVTELITTAKVSGIDTAMTTNGVLFNRKVMMPSIPFLNWVRFSLDAADAETYKKIHRGHSSHFNKVTDNIREAVKWRNENHCECTIGVQALLIPQNFDSMLEICSLADDMNVDYLILKPYSQHPSSIHKFTIDYNDYMYRKRLIEDCSWGNNLKVIFRQHAMEKLTEPRPYKKCLGLPFMSYIDSNGLVYACSAFLGNPDFVFGSIYEECFPAIWEGQRRKDVMKMIDEMGVEPCREICRLDEINRYLWNLTHKENIPHVNFI